MKCTICGHPQQTEIENALLARATFGSEEGSVVEAVAQHFDVSIEDLKMHAMFHVPLIGESVIKAINAPIGAEPNSLTRKLGLREADMLATVANEYLVTMKTMGRRINKMVQVSSIDEEDQAKQTSLAKMLTKPMVDLYVGMGSEIRQTVKTMGELDRILNGPEDSANAGLAALAAAIRKSDSE